MKLKKFVLVSVCMTGIFFARLFSVNAGIQSGGFSSGSLNYSLKYSSDFISSDKANYAIKRWNGVSSNVNLTYSASRVSNGIHVKIGVDEPTSGSDLGLTKYYNGDTRVTNAAARTRATCIVYSNRTCFKGVDGVPIRATTTHEVGHALSLTHTDTEGDIMMQGKKDYWALSSNDKYYLKRKWGE